VKILVSKVDGIEYGYSVSGIERIIRSVWDVPFGSGERAGKDVELDFIEDAKIEFPELIGSNCEKERLLEKLFQDDVGY
jgi:hypothetical protein